MNKSVFVIKKNMFKRFNVRAGIVLVVLLTGLSVGVRAQQMLTLEDAIAIALENNYDIRLAESDSALLGLDYSYRNVVFLPRLNATAGTVWTSNNQQQEFTDGTERKGDVMTNNINAAVTLNWTLFDGLKMFALKKKAEEYTRLG
mgnify:FL=1